ncbi:MAG TPA: TIGR04282 family arsenosugar biosynthesis glycosyltransferase [Dissulfurispiraceae bacterium]|nr:TIGR04282 family arsenosugar biosynthesis glycosyltransferase [Dissulfurispiraceae bacterium]
MTGTLPDERRNMLGVFLKYPAPGQVKTRLAASIGSEKAAECCRELAELVLDRTVSPEQYRRILFISPEERILDFVRWLPDETFLPQRGDTLGERMAAAVKMLLARGDLAVLIGTDIPDLHAQFVAEAFAALEDHDLVIGPARDGGYYLIGMKHEYQPLFEGIAWSTASVLQETVQKASLLGLSYRLLPELVDIDTFEDYKQWQNRSQKSSLRKDAAD